MVTENVAVLEEMIIFAGGKLKHIRNVHLQHHIE
jgi:hypothetical protein